MARVLWLSLWSCGACLWVAACTSDAALPTTCNLAYSCGPTQTCATQDGVNYACVSPGSGQAGDTCDPSLAPNAACGAGLICLGYGTPVTGTCTGWCDATLPCPSDQVCVQLITTFGVYANVCSISNASSCAINYTCGAGQTCWSLDGFAFQCMPAGTLSLAESCDPTQTTVECADGLVCLGRGDPPIGTCVTWCGGAGVCPSGQNCATLGSSYGMTLRVCQ